MRYNLLNLAFQNWFTIKKAVEPSLQHTMERESTSLERDQFSVEPAPARYGTAHGTRTVRYYYLHFESKH